MAWDNEFESEHKYGFEDDGREPIGKLTESEYKAKVQEIISMCKPRGGLEYVKNLNIEGEMACTMPMIAFDGLSNLEGLTGSKVGDLTALLIVLQDKRFVNFVKGFYEVHSDVRNALREWGRLQEGRC